MLPLPLNQSGPAVKGWGLAQLGPPCDLYCVILSLDHKVAQTDVRLFFYFFDELLLKMT